MKQSYATELFGQRLRELCDAKAPYSQIARDLDVNRQQFARYLNGTSMPRDALIRKMAEYFDVEISAFFQSQHQHAMPAPLDPVIAAMNKWNNGIITEPITATDLEDGLYMQYKQSFTIPGKVVCMLGMVSRDADGVVHWKRRYSVAFKSLFGDKKVAKVSRGVIYKTLGALILLDQDSVAGDLVIGMLRESTILPHASSVKTGVVMTHGRPGNQGPVCGVLVIEKLPDTAVMKYVRSQGFKDMSDLPQHIQYHFEIDPALPRGVLSIR